MKYCEEYWRDIDQGISVINNVSKLFGKRILITGGTGMIGSTVVEMLMLLNKKYNADISIYIAARDKTRVQQRFYTFVEGLDYFFVEFDATKESHKELIIDYIIYGASNANPALYLQEPRETIMANIYGLDKLLQDSIHNLQRLVYISSSEVYGEKLEKGSYYEEYVGKLDFSNIRACYPNAKRLAESLCSAYTYEYGIETVIVRPGHIYGPTITDSDNRASAQFTRAAVLGKNIVLKSAGNQLRSYCYTVDCASAILTILINGNSTEAYNISNRNSIISIRQLAEKFAYYGNVSLCFENPTDEELRSYNMMDNSSLNSEKLEKLGWHALFNIDKGVEQTIKFIK